MSKLNKQTSVTITYVETIVVIVIITDGLQCMALDKTKTMFH